MINPKSVIEEHKNITLFLFAALLLFSIALAWLFLHQKKLAKVFAKKIKKK